MRIVLLSDTHNKHRAIEVPDGDLLIHAGDSCGYGTTKEFIDFLGWFAKLPHKNKVAIAGNHDRCLENRTTRYLIQMMEDQGVNYLEDSSVTIDGVKFYGSPWQPAFCDWAFNLSRGKALKEKWDLIPPDTDVLITHGPPYGIGDKIDNTIGSVGCEELLKAVERIQPPLHVFGHIHEGYGIHLAKWTLPARIKTLFINTSNLNGSYHYTNKPVAVEFDPNTKLVSPLVQR